MKLRIFHKPAIAILFMFCWLNTAISQRDTSNSLSNSASTVLPDSIKKLPARVSHVEKTVSALNKKENTCDECKITCPDKMEGFSAKWILVFLPVFMFLLLGWFFVRLILNGYLKLDETLSIGAGAVVSTETVAADGAVTRRFSETPSKPVGSTSRLIAFLAGIVALLVSVCLITYYAYFMIAECQGNINFSELWTILAGLGIGIVPYGLNVLKGNKKEQ